MEGETKKRIQLSVNCYLYFQDEYLFLKRNETKKIDPGKINCIGGKVEAGEDYLTAALREITEETGYVLTAKDISFCGIVDFSIGYEKEWVACFFTAQVPTKHVPVGMDTDDGELMWVNKDSVVHSGLDVVDDVNHCFPFILEQEKLFFMNVEHDELGKVSQSTIQTIKR